MNKKADMNCDNIAIIYSKPNCPHCVEAKNLLKSRNISFEEKTLGIDATVEELLQQVGQPVRSVPQIFLNCEYVGGLSDLRLRL